MKAAIAAVALGAATASSTVAPVQAAGVLSAPAAQARDVTVLAAGGKRERYAADFCRPYNGPFGYYGNPYCEGGFSRYGGAGGYEIDLTPYFDGRSWRERRYRRWR